MSAIPVNRWLRLCRSSDPVRLSLLVLAAFLAAASPVQAADSADDATSARLVVFGVNAPVLVDLKINIDGQSLDQLRRQAAEESFKGLDRDGDRLLKGDEVENVPNFGRFANLPPVLGDAWTKVDSDGSGSVDLAEFTAHLDTAAGPAVTLADEPRLLSQNVKLISKLDGDGDLHVSVEEIAAGLRKLRSFDFDDDESLSVAELQPFPASMRQDNDAVEEVALALCRIVDEASLPDVADHIVTLYSSADATAGGSALSGASAGSEVDLTDADSVVDWLQSAPPDARLRLEMSTTRLSRIHPGEGPSSANARLGRVERLQRLSTILGATEVEFRVQNSSFMANDNVAFFLIQVRRVDNDKNGYLDQAEFPNLELPDAPFSIVDADDDGQIFPGEVQAFIEQKNRLARLQLELSVKDLGETLFDVLDRDVDRRLSPREFFESGSVLGQLDRNLDGRVAERELKASYRVTASLNSSGLLPASTVMQSRDTRLPIMRPVTEGPLWFRRMDRNQDGDVAWREFLGPKEDFTAIDTDGDGLIDASEAEAVTKMSLR